MSSKSANMMKRVIAFWAAMLYTIGGAVAQVNPTDVIGLWLSEEKDGKVEIFQKEDGTFAGRTRWMVYNGVENPRVYDVHNPDSTKRNQLIVGMEMMYGFEFKEGSWRNGKIYDPRSGKTYSARMKLKENDKNTLLFRGYLGIPLLGQTTTWTRVEE